jgi:hypothetical protein
VRLSGAKEGSLLLLLLCEWASLTCFSHLPRQSEGFVLRFLRKKRNKRSTPMVGTQLRPCRRLGCAFIMPTNSGMTKRYNEGG